MADLQFGELRDDFLNFDRGQPNMRFRPIIHELVVSFIYILLQFGESAMQFLNFGVYAVEVGYEESEQNECQDA